MDVRKSQLAFAVALALLIAALALHTCHSLGASTRVGSFNINQYPQRSGSPERVMSVIAELDAPIVALQEIGNLQKTRRLVAKYLGPDWRVRSAARCASRCVGFLYDSRRVELHDSTTHDSIRLHPGARPALEVRATVDGRRVALVNVHLKAGASGLPIRLRQLRKLSEITAAMQAEEENVVVLGDFNTLGGDDRAAMERFGAERHLSWATSVLECSHYHRRPSGCVTTTLDHAFTSHRPQKVEEAGACRSLGCDTGDQCPTWTREVSDHCPFVVQLR